MFIFVSYQPTDQGRKERWMQDASNRLICKSPLPKAYVQQWTSCASRLRKDIVFFLFCRHRIDSL